MIEMRGLTKRFKNVLAVDNLTLNVEEGDVFGFIGPNGAGKTTTIRMLATLLSPTSGTAEIAGYDILRHPTDVRRLVGYMPDFFGVYDDIKVWEYLDFFAACYNIPRTERKTVIDGVLELTDLAVKRDSYVEELSRGMKQRLCLAKTLLHDPKVLLLDEPASGLDPRARIELRELIKELQAMGKTIFISSHILHELADMCNKIGIIEQGRLIIAGDVEEISRMILGGLEIEVQLKGDADKAVGILAGLQDVHNPQARDDNTVVFEFGGTREELAEVLQTLVRNGVPVITFTEQRTNLEDVFMKVTKGIVS